MVDEHEPGPSDALKQRAALANELLAQQYPQARAELDFTNPLELLIATVLSAQSTDRRVNTVTVQLFARYRSAQDYAEADIEELQAIIKPVGFFRSKADALKGIGQALVANFDSHVPATLEELITLPGVGRKTANVVLGNAFNIPGITPDTHFMRVTRRLGWASASTPDGIEQQVGDLFDPLEWVQLCHNVIWHGRRRCHAKRPACGACNIAHVCPSFGEGPIDRVVAEGLVREPRR